MNGDDVPALHRRARPSRPMLYLAAAGALACSGCAREIYPVAGKVTHQGAPAAGATVFLLRRGAEPMNEPLTMGIVKADGSFTLVCGSLGEGAPPGDYDVLIEWKEARKTAKGPAQHGPGHPSLKSPDRLQGRYADPKHPRLHAVVKAQTNQLPPFELD
jgi:hypothetical protein